MNLTESDIKANGIYLGRMLNKWRERSVAIFALPEGDGTRVWTIGRPFKGGDPICCCEETYHYASAIRAAAAGRVYIYE